jgi:hypothetical protein
MEEKAMTYGMKDKAKVYKISKLWGLINGRTTRCSITLMDLSPELIEQICKGLYPEIVKKPLNEQNLSLCCDSTKSFLTIHFNDIYFEKDFLRET